MGKNMSDGVSLEFRPKSLQAEHNAFLHYRMAVEAAGSGRISFATARRIEMRYAIWVHLSDPEHAQERIRAAHEGLARRLAS